MRLIRLELTLRSPAEWLNRHDVQHDLAVWVLLVAILWTIRANGDRHGYRVLFAVAFIRVDEPFEVFQQTARAFDNIIQ